MERGVGSGHYPEAWRNAAPGFTTIELRPDPHNPYDRNAIALYLPSGQQAGYMRASTAAEYCRVITAIAAQHTVHVEGSIEQWGDSFGLSWTIPQPDYLARWWRTPAEHRGEVPLKMAVIRLAGATKPEQQQTILAGLGRSANRTVNLEFRPAVASRNQIRLDGYLDGALVGHLTPSRANQIPEVFRKATADGAVTLEANLHRSSSGVHRVEIEIETLF